MKVELPIYLDYSATTPIDPRVVEKMIPYMTERFGNPASRSHSFGWEAEKAVEEARNQVASAIHADPREIVWLSGATEANNLAIKGAMNFYKHKGRHLITSKTEHKAVLDTCRYLESIGFSVTYLLPQSNGLISLEALETAMRTDTVMVSIMHVNNEIGVIQPISEISALCQKRGILLHVDAAQSLGKILLDVNEMGVDLLSLSAHKIYGPKGMGALYVRRKPRVRLECLIHGGGHERGMRSGTLATHQIVGMGEACVIAQERLSQDYASIAKMSTYLWERVSSMEEVYLNGPESLQNRVPHILNISFNYVEGESLLMAVKDLALSSGSACTSSSLEPSYVLRALGRQDELAHSSLRISIGRFTTQEQIEHTASLLEKKVAHLRKLSPLWEMYLKGIDISQVQWNSH